MPNNSLRIVIDTNIWISFLIGKSLIGLTDAIIDNRVKILFSDDLFSELFEVLQRPKFKKYFSAAAIENLMILLHEKIELVDVINHFDDCRDKKDNFLLDLAVSGHANYLITGDADLLVLNPFQNVEIISYKLFQDFILSDTKRI
jgi:putative PIN family toxin of toxin-antitoxin system